MKIRKQKTLFTNFSVNIYQKLLRNLFPKILRNKPAYGA